MVTKNILLALLLSTVPIMVLATSKETKKENKKEQTYYKYVSETLSNNWQQIAIGTGVLITAGVITYLVLQSNTDTTPAAATAPTINTPEVKSLSPKDRALALETKVKELFTGVTNKLHQTFETATNSIKNTCKPNSDLSPKDRALALEAKVKELFTGIASKLDWAFETFVATKNPQPSPILQAARKRAQIEAAKKAIEVIAQTEAQAIERAQLKAAQEKLEILTSIK